MLCHLFPGLSRNVSGEWAGFRWSDSKAITPRGSWAPWVLSFHQDRKGVWDSPSTALTPGSRWLSSSPSHLCEFSSTFKSKLRKRSEIVAAPSYINPYLHIDNGFRRAWEKSGRIIRFRKKKKATLLKIPFLLCAGVSESHLIPTLSKHGFLTPPSQNSSLVPHFIGKGW